MNCLPWLWLGSAIRAWDYEVLIRNYLCRNSCYCDKYNAFTNATCNIICWEDILQSVGFEKSHSNNIMIHYSSWDFEPSTQGIHTVQPLLSEGPHSVVVGIVTIFARVSITFISGSPYSDTL